MHIEVIVNQQGNIFQRNGQIAEHMLRLWAINLRVCMQKCKYI